MFSLSKLLTAVFLPPGLFLLLIFVALYYFRGHRHLPRRRAVLSLLWLLAGLLYLLSIRPVADSLILPLEISRAAPGGEPAVCGALVVFGAGARPSGPDGASALRAREAFAIWRNSPGQIILSGGTVYGERWNSAQAMGVFLQELGVPGDYLTLEQKSRNTFENAMFTARVLKDRELSKPCLITSAYHMPRAAGSLAVFGVKVTRVPTDFKAYQADYGWRHFLPGMHSLGISTLALHEYLGMLYYMLAHGI